MAIWDVQLKFDKKTYAADECASFAYPLACTVHNLAGYRLFGLLVPAEYSCVSQYFIQTATRVSLSMEACAAVCRMHIFRVLASMYDDLAGDRFLGLHVHAEWSCVSQYFIKTATRVSLSMGRSAQIDKEACVAV